MSRSTIAVRTRARAGVVSAVAVALVVLSACGSNVSGPVAAAEGPAPAATASAVETTAVGVAADAPTTTATTPTSGS